MITVEDVNSAKFSNQGFYWHEIDTSLISEDEDFDWTPYDFCKIKRRTVSGQFPYEFSLKLDDTLWTKAYALLNKAGRSVEYYSPSFSNGIFTFKTTSAYCRIILYLGTLSLSELSKMSAKLKTDVANLTLKELLSPQKIEWTWFGYVTVFSQYNTLSAGYNPIYNTLDQQQFMGYLLVNLVRTDFQFNCTQSLVIGKVNKVFLGTDSDYKPNGDLVGEYTPVITVDYKGETLPVQYDSTNNDYYFNLDLTDKTNTGKVRFTVNVATNDVLNASSTDVILDSDYELINSESKFNSFVQTGGVGRLGVNIGLTADININKDVYIIGNDKTINLNSHSIIVKSDKSFKAENTVFANGEPCIIQHTDSKVELTDCTVTGCTGIGSVIKCDIDLTSLDNPNDFTTVLNGCTLADNTNMILHSGDLNVDNCTVDGAIGNSKYPYFLYQVDGTATLIGNTFNIEKDSQITSDIGFNSCIFMVGETAIINGLSHSEWQDNGLTSFLESPQFNRSTVDLTYYYDLISDYITMTASNGYCHSVSGEDFVFKTNCNVRRD